MKRIITILTAILVLVFSFSASAYASEISFTDVNATDWYYKNLQDLIQKDITSGYPDGTFKPNNTLKFEEFVKMIVVAVENKTITAEEGQQWYEGYINYAKEHKYISEEQALLIGQNIRRGTMAEIIFNVLSEKEEIKKYTADEYKYLSNKLSDVSEIDTKTLTVNAIGIISGYPDGTFKPNNSLKRSETVAVISRLLNKDMRLPITIDLTKVVTDDMSLDELPAIDLSHLYNYPTLSGKGVKADNRSNDDWVNTEKIAKEYVDYMKLTHNRDYRTIGSKSTQYKNDLLYYINGYKEYQGKEYSKLRAYYLQYYLSTNDKKMYDFVMQQDFWIEYFLDKWVKDTVDNKVQVQAEFYTDSKLVILAENVAVRGTLRIKYDSHNNPGNIKEELDFVHREAQESGRRILNLPESKYDIYMDYEDVPNLKVGKWYEIDMDVVVSNRAHTLGLDEKASHNYEYIYPIAVRQLN